MDPHELGEDIVVYLATMVDLSNLHVKLLYRSVSLSGQKDEVLRALFKELSGWQLLVVRN